MNGEMREGVGEPSKTGWVYLLDRKTGKPIYPIPEVKVPQDPSQKTWPTQPEPTMPPFSPIEATPEAVENGRRSGVRGHAETESRRDENLHPDELRPELDQPDPNAAVGGDNWPPSSFDPEENMYFVCSQAGALGLIVPAKEPQIRPGPNTVGSETVSRPGSTRKGS